MPHYADETSAAVGDYVKWKGSDGKIRIGVVQIILPNSESCNGTVFHTSIQPIAICSTVTLKDCMLVHREGPDLAAKQPTTPPATQG